MTDIFQSFRRYESPNERAAPKGSRMIYGERTRITTHVDASLFEAAKAHAKDRGISVAAFVRLALRNMVKGEGQ